MRAGRFGVGGLAAIAVAVSAASWGAWSVFLRPAELPAATAGTIVFAVMGLVMLPSAWRSPPAAWSRRAWALLAANAVLDALNLLTFFAALQHTTVAIAVLAHYLAPVLVAIGAPVIDRQRVPGARVAALVAVGGLALVLEPWRGGGAPIGAILGAVSAVGYAGNVFIVRRLASTIGAVRAVSYHSFGAALVMLPFAIAAGGATGAVDAGAIAWLAIGAIVLGAIGGVAFVWGVGVIGSAPAAMLAYLEPLVAVAIGALVWSEPFGRFAALGGALVLASGLYVARASTRAAAAT